MSSQDEARTARMQKYKEERRKQLAARTATLFSANVTDRRRRNAGQPQSGVAASSLKSLSELNLNTASTSVPIRTTRTSRLRAAAAATNSLTTLRKTDRTSSVQSLEDDQKKKPVKPVDRTNLRPASKKQNHEKENLKSASTTCFPEKDGAIKLKTKHSTNKANLEKDRISIAASVKAKVTENIDDRRRHSSDKSLADENKPLLNGIEPSFDNAFEEPSKIALENFEKLPEDHGEFKVNIVSEESIVKESSAVPKEVKNEGVSGFLGAVCVAPVESFNDLLTALCSPREADRLFEEILVQNGVDGNGELRKMAPECKAPCRRSQPPPFDASTPKRAQPPVDNGITKTKNRRPLEALPKTESTLPSSRLSPNSNSPFGVKQSPPKPSATPHKPYEKRRDSGSKASCIPLSKKSLDKHSRSSTSPVKQDLTKDAAKLEKSKQDTPRGKTIRRSPEKAKSDTENNRNDRRHRAQKDSDFLSEKYHSKKRLTSLDNSTRNTSDAKKTSPKLLNNSKPKSNNNTSIMSTLHDVRPHSSRLSQEMDSLAALTKQTLDRVNKLSNNLTSNKINLDSAEPRYDSYFTSEQKNNSLTYNYGLGNERPSSNRGVTERLKDIDTAAQRLIDFEKQSAMFSDLNNDASQNRRPDTSNISNSHTPVSILKRKSIHEDSVVSNTPNHAIASPPVTFSPSVIEPRNSRTDKRQGILKKRRSLDESQVARQRSCSPEVSFADDGSSDTSKPILKNRRSSLEDVIRNRSPDGQIQGILKRKMSREEDSVVDDISHGSPEPHSILKRKSNSSSSSSTTSSHVSIAQAVLLAAAGGAEIVEDDKEAVRPILKKKSFSEERPCLDILPSDTPKPILKKKSIEHEEHDFELPKKPILKSSKKMSGDDGHASSFELSEDDRSSRRSSLLRSRTSDHSGSECEAAVRPILKQRGSSLTRERSQSPRPRLSFCADNDAGTTATNFSSDANDLSAAGPRRVLNPAASSEDSFPSAVLRRRNLRPNPNPRSKSVASDVNDELLCILNNRRLKVDNNCDNEHPSWDLAQQENEENNRPKTFPSIAARIRSMEQALINDSTQKDPPSTSRSRRTDKERYKTQPITVEEMRSVTSSLEPCQASFQPFGLDACSFPTRPVEIGTSGVPLYDPEKDPFAAFNSPSNLANSTAKSTVNGLGAKDDSYGEATFLDFENKKQTLDDIEQEVNKVRVALDEDCRALEEDERQQAEADTWSLTVSCDSGVYNRASSRDSGPHSGEELCLIEAQQIRENHTTNSSSTDWSPPSLERGILTMDRVRKSTENEHLLSPDDKSCDEKTSANTGVSPNSNDSSMERGLFAIDRVRKSTENEPMRGQEDHGSDEERANESGFALGLVKSNSVVARASMWQQLQQQAKGSPKPLLRHSRSKIKDTPPLADRFKSQPIAFQPEPEPPKEVFSLTQSKSTANVLDRDEDDYDDDSPTGPVISPEVKPVKQTTVVPSKAKILAKGESSEGLKDEGIDSSSDDESASATTVSSSEKSCSSSDSSEEIPDPKPRRFQRKNNKLKNSRTESDITRLQEPHRYDARKIQLPGANEFKERLVQAKNTAIQTPLLGKLGRKPSEEKKDDDTRFRRFVKKLDEPIQLGKLRRPVDKAVTKSTAGFVEEKPPPFLRISALNQEAKNKFFGLEPQPVKKEKSIDELTAAVRKYIPPVTKSMSTQVIEVASGSDGESSGGREVRQINTRGRHRFGGGGVQRSATHAEMPHRGGTIAERLAALQAAGANDWRARVCRLSPEKDDSKALERAKNKINESLNAAVDDKKKAQIEEDVLGQNILADRRTKLETAAQGWRKRVPQNDASLFTVAGRLERDKVTTTPPLTPPPAPVPAPLTPLAPLTPATPATPGVPTLNKFRSRKPNSPTNGFASGPLRSASCAVVNVKNKPKESPRVDRESFKRSHSVSESISRLDEKDETSPYAEKSGCPVRVPRADDETFQAFFAPVLQQEKPQADLDVDLDAIDSGSRQLLASEWTRRARRERRHVASRNPLKALAARTDLKEEYVAPPSTLRDQLIKEKATANCGLAAEALAALATKEDFSSVALRCASTTSVPCHGTKSLMLMQVKGRRRVQTRLVEPKYTSVNRGDCFVLVTPDNVFLYIGLYANVIERNRSTDIANHIHNTKDLGCKNSTNVILIDEQTKKYSNKHWNEYWSLLGLNEGIEDYKPVETGHPDEDEIYESCIVQTNMCYEVIDDELVPIKEYWGQMPKISMLNQTKTIVFDFGSEMYIWYGKNVPLESRRRAAQLAQELFDEGYNYEDCHINPLNAAENHGAREKANSPVKMSKTRPEWAILSKVTQHMETILFKEKFLDWPDYTRIIKVKPQENKANTTEIIPCDAEEMWSNEYQDPDLILEGSHVGRGTSYYDKETMRHYNITTKSVCKWVIQEYDYQKENESDLGEFFSGDSYIIRWEYQITVSGRELNGKPSKHNMTGRDRCAYFCWQGKDATSNEKGAAALLTVEIDKEKGPQIRVAQGNEPPAFLNLFQGNLVIHTGKKDTDKSRFRLFVTRGNLSNEAYLLQVPCSVRQLRSRGSLLLVDTEKGCLYIWHGARSLKHTKNIAIELSNKLIARKSDYLFGSKVCDVKITEVKEGEEPKEVLEALGVANKQHYNSVLNGGSEVKDVTPRLYHFTDLGGHFEANEVLSPLRHEDLVTPFPFEQKELYSASQPALFLLDDGVAVWVWQGWWPRGEDGQLEPAERNTGVGAFAARWQAMRAAALRTADAYWKASRGGRGDIRLVTAGLEPQTFTDLFDTWQERDDAAEANIAHGYKAGEVLSGACELSRLTSHDAVLPLAALQRRPLPDHVDPHHLERHLSSPDFLEAFGITKEEFSVLPAWKQTNMKKDVGLF